MGAVSQFSGLCVRIQGAGSGGSDVAVIFAEPSSKELDYLFGNRNLTRYVLRLLAIPPTPVPPPQTADSSTNSDVNGPSSAAAKDNGFLDSLDYIASHLKNEMLAEGNLDIAAVKEEIKVEESLEALLLGGKPDMGGLLERAAAATAVDSLDLDAAEDDLEFAASLEDDDLVDHCDDDDDDDDDDHEEEDELFEIEERKSSR